MIKMYCIFSQEAIDAMGGNRGKMAAQAGHAYLHSFWNALDEGFWENTKGYRDSNKAMKICLVVPTTEELVTLYKSYIGVCGNTLVKDAGMTVFKEPTITCVGIGPISEEDIGEDLKALKVFI
jgi:peptidyl-tRNA hydrolase